MEKVEINNQYFNLIFHNNSNCFYYYKDFKDYIRFGFMSSFYNKKEIISSWAYNNASSWAYHQISLALSSNKGLLPSVFLANDRLFRPDLEVIDLPKLNLAIFDYIPKNKKLIGVINGENYIYYQDNENLNQLNYNYLNNIGQQELLKQDKSKKNKFYLNNLLENIEFYNYPSLGQFSEVNSFEINLNKTNLLLTNNKLTDLNNIKNNLKSSSSLSINFNN